MAAFCLALVIIVAAIATSSCQQVEWIQSKDIKAGLGEIKCTSTGISYKAVHQSVFDLIFKDPSMKGNSTVHSVIIANRANQPECVATRKGDFHDIFMNIDACSTRFASSDGFTFLRNDVYITVRTHFGPAAYLDKTFYQPIGCTTDLSRGVSFPPLDYVAVVVSTIEILPEFDIPLKVSTSSSDMENFLGSNTPTQVFSMTIDLFEQDKKNWEIFVDSCWATGSSSSIDTNRFPIYDTRGCLPPHLSQMVLISPSTHFTIHVAAFDFLGPQVHFHCQVNICRARPVGFNANPDAAYNSRCGSNKYPFFNRSNIQAKRVSKDFTLNSLKPQWTIDQNGLPIKNV